MYFLFNFLILPCNLDKTYHNLLLKARTIAYLVLMPWTIHILGSDVDEHIKLFMWLRALIVQAQRRNYQGCTLPLS